MKLEEFHKKAAHLRTVFTSEMETHVKEIKEKITDEKDKIILSRIMEFESSIEAIQNKSDKLKLNTQQSMKNTSELDRSKLNRIANSN